MERLTTNLFDTLSGPEVLQLGITTGDCSLAGNSPFISPDDSLLPVEDDTVLLMKEFAVFGMAKVAVPEQSEVAARNAHQGGRPLGGAPRRTRVQGEATVPTPPE